MCNLDRLARLLKQSIETLADLGQLGIDPCSITEAIDTRMSGGKLILHTYGALAEFEGSVFRGRTRAALTAAWARVRAGGCSTLLNDGALDEARGWRSGRSAGVAPQF